MFCLACLVVSCFVMPFFFCCVLFFHVLFLLSCPGVVRRRKGRPSQVTWRIRKNVERVRSSYSPKGYASRSGLHRFGQVDRRGQSLGNRRSLTGELTLMMTTMMTMIMTIIAIATMIIMLSHFFTVLVAHSPEMYPVAKIKG